MHYSTTLVGNGPRLACLPSCTHGYPLLKKGLPVPGKSSSSGKRGGREHAGHAPGHAPPQLHNLSLTAMTSMACILA